LFIRQLYPNKGPDHIPYCMKFISSNFHVWEYLWKWIDHSVYVIQYGSFKKYVCTNLLLHQVHKFWYSTCTNELYSGHVPMESKINFNYERDLKLYEDPQCSVQKMILHFLVLHLKSGNKVLWMKGQLLLNCLYRSYIEILVITDPSSLYSSF